MLARRRPSRACARRDERSAPRLASAPTAAARRVFTWPGSGSFAKICNVTFGGRDGRAVAGRELRGIGAAPVGEANPPHRKDRPPRPFALPAPAGRDDALREAQRGACRALQATRQLNVLHQRLVGIAAHGLEERAQDEDALVAGRDSGQPRARIHHRSDPREHGRSAGQSSRRIVPSAVRCAPFRRRGRVRRRRAGGNRHAGTASTSPDATAAPAFICVARPDGATKARSASGDASASVASVLPPSTTITSCPAARSGCSGASVATMRRASFRAGTMIETRTAAGRARWPRPARRRSSIPVRPCSRSSGRPPRSARRRAGSS